MWTESGLLWFPQKDYAIITVEYILLIFYRIILNMYL